MPAPARAVNAPEWWRIRSSHGSHSRNDIIAQYLVRPAFVPNPLGAFGNLERNRFRGPGKAVVDLGPHKNFPITERVNTQFRFETIDSFTRATSALGRIDPRLLTKANPEARHRRE